MAYKKNNKRFSDKISNSSDYNLGYLHGQQDSFNATELDAYYCGVGYAKKIAGDKHIGFNSDKEREQFEAGMRNKNKHFRSYRAEPPSFLERLLGGKAIRRENAVGEYENKRMKSTRKRISKLRRLSKRKTRYKTRK